MGISKLTTFMNDNPRLHKEIQLHSIKVVVDGNSLYHSIFYKNEVDVIHGGDYYDYALKIREFFSLFQSCNIQPFVVFDGGNEPDDKKFETTRRRMEHRQELIDKLAKNKKNDDSVVPILAFDTFKAVLDEMSITLAVCDFEADKEIGLLANELSCPVMSSDSDFFMLPLTAGFIHFDWVKLTVHKTENGSSDYLPARIYYVHNFVEKFPSLGENVLPVLATLVGNDYIDTKIFKSFYDHIGGLKFEKSQFRMPNSEDKIYKVIKWLDKSRKSVDEVMETCKQFEDGQSISSAFEITTKAFTFSETEKDKKMQSLFWGEESNTVGKPLRDFNAISEWYVLNHRKGVFPPRLMDIITTKKRFLTPQMESRSSTISYQCSIKIRACIYGILLSEDIQNGKKIAVEEYRYKDNFKRGTLVDHQQILANTPTTLTEIKNIPQPEKEKMLGMILNIHSLSQFKLTKDLELVMGIVLFWIKESNPKVTLYHLKSVIICMIMLKVKSKGLFQHDATGGEKNLIETAVLGMTIEGLEEANVNFHTYDTKLEHNVKDSLDCNLIHGFAQFQTCIMATMHLNSLLLHPFPSPCIPLIFSGTFLYKFCLELSVQKDPDEFIHELLLKDSTLDNAYRRLFNVVLEAIGGPQGLATYFMDIWGCVKVVKSNKRSRAETPPLPTSNPFGCLDGSDSKSDN